MENAMAKQQKSLVSLMAPPSPSEARLCVWVPAAVPAAPRAAGTDTSVAGRAIVAAEKPMRHGGLLMNEQWSGENKFNTDEWWLMMVKKNYE